MQRMKGFGLARGAAKHKLTCSQYYARFRRFRKSDRWP